MIGGAQFWNFFDNFYIKRGQLPLHGVKSLKSPENKDCENLSECGVTSWFERRSSLISNISSFMFIQFSRSTLRLRESPQISAWEVAKDPAVEIHDCLSLCLVVQRTAIKMLSCGIERNVAFRATTQGMGGTPPLRGTPGEKGQFQTWLKYLLYHHHLFSYLRFTWGQE